VNFLGNNSEIFNETKTVMLCVKPNDMTNLLNEVSNKIDNSHLILSIAAGIKIKQIENVISKLRFLHFLDFKLFI
jgi:pyrroline-5-carboxylate reductase